MHPHALARLLLQQVRAARNMTAVITQMQHHWLSWLQVLTHSTGAVATFEPVYLFGHKDAAGLSVFVQTSVEVRTLVLRGTMLRCCVLPCTALGREFTWLLLLPTTCLKGPRRCNRSTHVYTACAHRVVFLRIHKQLRLLSTGRQAAAGDDRWPLSTHCRGGRQQLRHSHVPCWGSASGPPRPAAGQRSIRPPHRHQGRHVGPTYVWLCLGCSSAFVSTFLPVLVLLEPLTNQPTSCWEVRCSAKCTKRQAVKSRMAL
jgi:hypothetical protein